MYLMNMLLWKKKLVRGNNSPFRNKALAKAFMHRAKLKNKYNKNPTEQNYLSYKKQRNYCVNLLKREKALLQQPRFKYFQR